MHEKLVIALGGNALQSKDTAPTAEGQLEVVKRTAAHLAELSKQGYEMAIVHGNGPQVGRIVLAGETAASVVPPMPFDVCGAMSQGYIGYHIQQALKYALAARGRNIPVVSITTQVVVDRLDPAFQNPTKPIGGFCDAEEAKRLEAEKGYIMREEATKGWRRVVPSPQPRRIGNDRRLFRLGIPQIKNDGGTAGDAGLGYGDLGDHSGALSHGTVFQIVLAQKPLRVLDADTLDIGGLHIHGGGFLSSVLLFHPQIVQNLAVARLHPAEVP